MNKHKLAIFLLLAGAAAFLFTLAAGLSQVELKPGQPLALFAPSMAGQAPGQSPVWIGIFLLVLQGLMAILIILAPITLIVLLMTKQGRKQLLLLLANLAIVWLLFMGLGQVASSQETEPITAPMLESVPMVDEDGAPPAEFTANPPEWVSWVASLVLAAVLAVMSVGLWRLFRRPRPLTTLERLAREAQDALDRLALGEDLRDTIPRCYLEMVQVVEETRGIARAQHVTPHEFEILLTERGLPAEALARLTQLFEAVRYGSHSASPPEKQLAISCLRDIAAACQEDKLHAA